MVAGLSPAVHTQHKENYQFEFRRAEINYFFCNIHSLNPPEAQLNFYD